MTEEELKDFDFDLISKIVKDKRTDEIFKIKNVILIFMPYPDFSIVSILENIKDGKEIQVINHSQGDNMEFLSKNDYKNTTFHDVIEAQGMQLLIKNKIGIL